MKRDRRQVPFLILGGGRGTFERSGKKNVYAERDAKGGGIIPRRPNAFRSCETEGGRLTRRGGESINLSGGKSLLILKRVSAGGERDKEETRQNHVPLGMLPREQESSMD